MADDCLFCRMIRGDVPVKQVAETDDCLAFRDINPQAPVHVLIVPKTHFGSLNEVSDGIAVGKMTHLAKQIAQWEGISDSGYRTVINTNADGGQSVAHLHMHLLGGRRMAWPPG